MSHAVDRADDYSFDEGPIRPGVRIGSYVVERLLGSGGMGAVFAARHIGLDKQVVLKSLHRIFAVRAESVQRFVREGRAASKIRHPHVVDVTDVGTHEGIPFLVMEYLEGEDLEVYLKRKGTLDAPEIVRIMLPVLDAIATAHESGVVHRDLKPSNIFLSKGARGEVIPKVLDFGIAKILDTEGPDRMSLTRTGSFVGTPYYASPEQAKSGASADAQSDQFSIGAILYELASGRTPVQGKTPFEVLCGIVSGAAVPFSTLRSDWNPLLEHAVERALAYEPADRFASVRELGVALMPLAEPEIAARWRRVFGAPELPARPALSALAYMQTMLPQDLGASVDSARSVEASSPVDLRATRPSSSGVISPTAASMASVSVATGPVAALVPARRSGQGLLVLSIAAAFLAVMGVAGFVLAPSIRARFQPPPAETPPPRFAGPPIVIAAAPESAMIEVDGVMRGRGRVSLPLDGQPHRIRVSAVGHTPQDLMLAPDGSGLPASIALIAEPAPPVDPTVELAGTVDPAGGSSPTEPIAVAAPPPTVEEPAATVGAAAPTLPNPIVSATPSTTGTRSGAGARGRTGTRAGGYPSGGATTYGGRGGAYGSTRPAGGYGGGTRPGGTRLGNNNAPVLR